MTVAQAMALLKAVGAPDRLLRHAELVREAADLILDALGEQRIPVDGAFVRAGAVLHDAGKSLHPEELSAAGARHEAAGERMLVERGVPPALARVCRSHAQWASMDTSLEELLVALADKLWKGVRVPQLEDRVISEASARANRERWDLFVALDSAFEAIAADGDDRLARSHEAPSTRE